MKQATLIVLALAAAIVGTYGAVVLLSEVWIELASVNHPRFTGRMERTLTVQDHGVYTPERIECRGHDCAVLVSIMHDKQYESIRQYDCSTEPCTRTKSK